MQDNIVTDSLYTGDTDVLENEVSDSVFYDETNEQNWDTDSESNSDENVIDAGDDLYTEDSDVSEDESGDLAFDDETNEDNGNYDSESNSGGNVIDVDGDFGGDLQGAISAANEGDIVRLGNNTYYTSGITVDKNIVLEGQGGSVIDGGGTSDSIISLTPEAAGAIVRGIEITNGNNGLYSYGASDLTLENLDVNNIGLDQTMRDGQNNTGIILDHADGARIINTNVQDIGRKGVSIGDTDGASVDGLTVTNVNLAAEHSQSHDAAGIKFFNTDNVSLTGGYFSDINAIHIWNDTTNGTTIKNNVVENVGEDFVEPSFNDNLEIYGIYNEKSSNATIENNQVSANDGFLGFRATEFSTETMSLGSNDFSSFETNSTDYWVNESAEKLVATTGNPGEADFSSFSDDYYGQANIG